MDFGRNVPLSGGLPSEYEPEQLFSPSYSKLGSLDDLFSGGNNTEGDMNSEWLSIFVEDCLSSSGNCLPPVPILTPQIAQNKTSISTGSKIIPKAEPSEPLKAVKFQKGPSSSSLSSSILQKYVIPGKARSKTKRGPIGNKAQRIIWAHHLQMSVSDPPLLQQAHWLADSELILPKNEENNNNNNNIGIMRARNEEMKEEVNSVIMEKEEGRTGSLEGSYGQHARRCTHCLAQRTPQWRAGPLGPKTLCNACGVRYKSGRLLPEYRPAKSPTFVGYKHSNFHKKVLEMRTIPLPSNS